MLAAVKMLINYKILEDTVWPRLDLHVSGTIGQA
jgi:hypothetical protein